MPRMHAERVIRRANLSDVDLIVRCVQRAYAPYIELMGREPAPMLADYPQLVRDGVVHVAARDGDIEGLVVVWPESNHVYVDNIATAPSSRGTGVGRALLDWVEQHTRAIGYREIRLYTNVAMIENLSYYERRGFVETHRSSDSGYARVHFSKRI